MGGLSVTAIIPAFNRARFIAEAIESTLSQSRPPDDIIVVDDASTDATADVAAAYPKVTVLRLPRNLGASGARNAGLDAATGDVIAWLDSDDVWLPAHCERLSALLEQHAETVMAFSGIELEGSRQGSWIAESIVPGVPFDATLVAFEQTTPLTMSAAMMRRDALIAIGGLDAALRCSVDFDLYLRLALHGWFVGSHDLTVRYRLHGDQISANQIRQVDTMYRTRLRLVRDAEQNGRRELAATLRQKLAALWARDLRLAWWRRDMKRLRMLWQFAEAMPPDMPELRAFRYRRLVPSAALRLWDRFDTSPEHER